MKIFLTMFLLVQLSYARYDELSIPREDGSTVNAYLKYPDNIKDFSIIVNISGSKCKSEYAPSEVSENYSKFKMAQLQVEKYGIDKNFTSDQYGEIYRLKNSISQRRDDHIAVVNYIKKHYSNFNGRVYLVGGSEGTVVAPLLGVSELNVRAMSLWAGARSLNMKEEFLLNLKKGNHLCEDTALTQIAFNTKFDEIFKDNKSSKLWCSSPEKGSVNSYQWWSHILDYNPLNDFLKFKGNIFVAHGTRDKMMPVESTYKTRSEFAKRNRKNLTVKIHKDLDHGCTDSEGKNHCNEVFGEIHSWLLNQIKKDNQTQELIQ